MATGSGKTLAMSLCIVWSYFHALYEPDSPMATTFLVIAPNVIVFERLKSDFGDGATFRRDPLVPREWAAISNQRDSAGRLTPVTVTGVLYLTNIQRLYEPPARKSRRHRIRSRRWLAHGSTVTYGAVARAEQLFDRIASGAASDGRQRRGASRHGRRS